MRHAWAIETEHYTIRTTHSIEAGARLGKKLEELYLVWRQLFIRYYATHEQVVAMFNRRAVRLKLPRHEVAYYRDRQQYTHDLHGMMPGIDKTVGMYVGHKRRAYGVITM